MYDLLLYRAPLMRGFNQIDRIICHINDPFHAKLDDFDPELVAECTKLVASREIVRNGMVRDELWFCVLRYECPAMLRVLYENGALKQTCQPVIDRLWKAILEYGDNNQLIIDSLTYLLDLGFAKPKKNMLTEAARWRCESFTALGNFLMGIGYMVSENAWHSFLNNLSCFRQEEVDETVSFYTKNGIVVTPENTPYLAGTEYFFPSFRFEFIHQTFGFPIPPLQEVVKHMFDEADKDVFMSLYGNQLAASKFVMVPCDSEWVLKETTTGEASGVPGW